MHNTRTTSADWNKATKTIYYNLIVNGMALFAPIKVILLVAPWALYPNMCSVHNPDNLW